MQSAANSQTSALLLVSLSRTDRLRVYIYLDQKDAAFVHAGSQAEISDPSRPDVKRAASITRISGELDPRTRMLHTQGNKVHFRPVVAADSDGKTVRISSGLEEGQQLVLNPRFGISDNAQVQPAEAATGNWGAVELDRIQPKARSGVSLDKLQFT